MDASLQRRIDEIRRLKDEFGLDQQRIADNTEPTRTRVTIARVLSGQDERYLTESNVAAIEKGIEKILAEYRKKLCK
jgi:predicted transcriptional regulator